jgi:hypothetical protein
VVNLSRDAISWIPHCPRTPFNPLNRYLTPADFLRTSRLALVIENIYADYPALRMANGAFKRIDNVVNRAVVTGSNPALQALLPGYQFPQYRLFENTQVASSDYNPPAPPDSACYMLHMAYDTAAPGGQSSTTNPTNCIVTLADLPL